MNRIELSDLQLASPHESSPPLEQPAASSYLTAGPPHSLFSPLHYEKHYAYPLVVWLHGDEGNENQLRQVMPLISMRNYVGVSTRGTVANKSTEGSFRWEQTSREIFLAEHRILDSIEQAEEHFNLHSSRIFLAGYQSGGTMALRIALNHPERFAGAASIGGPFPAGEAPLRSLRRARDLPIFLAQSRYSTAYSIETACQEMRLFHTAGLKAAIRQYPCEDELDTQMLSDLNSWLMEQVTGTVELAPPSPTPWLQGEEN